MIKEVIVVEGKDDIAAVKRAVDAELIAVGGFGINRKVIDRIKEAQKRQGVIILTDPDFAGEKIRKIISKRVKGIKHAYISQKDGIKNGDIGVENALPETIIDALKNAKCEIKEKRKEFDINDMVFFGLTGKPDSKDRRDTLGKELGIGYCNTSQFLFRLNNYGITKEEFKIAVDKINKRINKVR
ncbi:ribonuclease M5 [Clostridium luticellarii]|jgi:ribonuclease M5|uniref:Ribonuclease M5 n=1 Tax=Clostridium luticellarii TaxID=1691940 RepID=A0A2T0BE23_9CLOT|nr:ribonuclease M5 [Clostridium luticellarii]MCI1944914.1 ribonuclease M5 [Clostridium luticellarii]MCI1968410.1 ribonuclease M5 [Clostridium luticellarii]MCI1995408.1 ribonuclease M5 [Clostridium luticellarii]MCI2039471.1 ribonuclease M5 [Clostridium luticellarii]PRR82125.1 Ribonuclease M5 [Clostridium luticellarii]